MFFSNASAFLLDYLKFLRKYADSSDENSIANKWRRKRFVIFKKLIEHYPRPVKILDVGGTEDFWVKMNFTDPNEVNVTVLNTADITVTLPNFKFIKINGKDLSTFSDKQFDAVFSNSVIEHLGNNDEQKMMSGEIIRTGKSYFIQSPNYYFPVEQHFLFPFFQFMPDFMKIFLVRNFSLGWFEKAKTKSEAKQLIDSVKLITKKELMELFPGSNIHKEKFAGLTKSFIAYK